MFLGDFAEDYATMTFTFSTRKDTGLPTVLTGSPVITIYKASSTSGKTSAESYITLTIDFNSKVGLNHVLVDLSGDAFFAIGNDYHVVITTGTVNSINVIGETVATFSIENRFIEADVVKWLGTACKTPATAGVPKIDLDHLFGVLLTEGGAGRLKAAFTKLFDVATPTLVASDVMRGTNSAATPAQVNTEVSDVLKTDTVTLPGQTAPPLAPTFEEMISWLYKVLRNRKTQTSTQWSLLADDESTVDAKAVVSDNGTTAIKEEILTGP